MRECEKPRLVKAVVSEAGRKEGREGGRRKEVIAPIPPRQDL